MEGNVYNKVGKGKFEKVKETLWDSLKNEEKLKTLPPIVRDGFIKTKDLDKSATLSILIDHFAYHLSGLIAE